MSFASYYLVLVNGSERKPRQIEHCEAVNEDSDVLRPSAGPNKDPRPHNAHDDPLNKDDAVGARKS